MSRLRIQSGAPDSNGTLVAVTPARAGWTHVGFVAIRLMEGQTYRGGGEDGRETCLVILSGTVDIVAGTETFTGLGVRRTVFDGPPAALYLAAGYDYAITASVAAEVAICTAPGSVDRPARVIAPETVPLEIRGIGTNRRYVRDILPETSVADSLLVVEVVTPGGNWSSYPPHKHDTDALPAEAMLEEIYYHRVAPPGFAFQRIYTDDRSIDEAIVVEDGDVVLVPRGYHPVAAAHGHDLYYLNVMAGPVRQWRFSIEASHAVCCGSLRNTPCD